MLSDTHNLHNVCPLQLSATMVSAVQGFAENYARIHTSKYVQKIHKMRNEFSSSGSFS